MSSVATCGRPAIKARAFARGDYDDEYQEEEPVGIDPMEHYKPQAGHDAAPDDQKIMFGRFEDFRPTLHPHQTSTTGC